MNTEIDSLDETSRYVEVPVNGVRTRLWARTLPATSPLARRRFLLLHGNPSHGDHWESNLEFLRSHGDVAVYDAPGFGRSPTRSGPLSLDFLADVAAAFADSIGWTSAIDVIGHSHGGAVAQTLAARSARHVRSLILLSTMGVPAHPAIRLAMLPGAAALMHGIARRATSFPCDALAATVARLGTQFSFAPDQVPTGFWERELALSVATPEIQRSCVRVNDGDPTRQLRRQAKLIDTPVLAIHGRQDGVVPLEYGRRLFELLAKQNPRNRFEAIDGGHNVHMCRPTVVHALLNSWLI